jgi:hypothetical protein
MHIRGRMLSETTDQGYNRVSLNDSAGRSLTLGVHRIVLEAFHGPPPRTGLQCCHINGDPSDNRVENLRWGTARENVRDRVAHQAQIRRARKLATMVLEGADAAALAAVAREVLRA